MRLYHIIKFICSTKWKWIVFLRPVILNGLNIIFSVAIQRFSQDTARDFRQLQNNMAVRAPRRRMYTQRDIRLHNLSLNLQLGRINEEEYLELSVNHFQPVRPLVPFELVGF